LISLEMATVLMGGFRLSEEPKTAQVMGQAATQVSNTKELGKLLYTAYLYPLQIAAFILLVAVISAIALTLRERKDGKYISASDQVRVKARDRMEVIKMDATKKIADSAGPTGAEGSNSPEKSS
jgi:NADH-quinone oxidoreductase subunit J